MIEAEKIFHLKKKIAHHQEMYLRIRLHPKLHSVNL